MTMQTLEKTSGLMQIQKILHLAEEKHLEPNEYVFKEGEEDHNFYIIMQGQIEISKKTSDGKDKVIAQIRQGEILGEGVLSGTVIKPASARTVTSVQLLTITKEQFDKLISHDPKTGVDFLLSVLGSLNDRVTRTDIKLLALYEINKLMNIHRDDISKLAQGLVQKLIVITESRNGAMFLRNPFEESYRMIYSTSDKINEKTFDTFDKSRSQIISNGNFQYLFINLKDVGYLVLRREMGDSSYEDDHLRLLILVAEQAGNAIESASRRASEKARNILHQRKIVL